MSNIIPGNASEKKAGNTTLGPRGADGRAAAAFRENRRAVCNSKEGSPQ